MFNHLQQKFQTPPTRNADDIDLAVVNKDYLFGAKAEVFKKLWDKIKTKTRYIIQMDDDMFKTSVLLEMNSRWAYVDRVKLVYEDGDIKYSESSIDGVGGTENAMGDVATMHKTPDILRVVSEQCNIPKSMVYDLFIASKKSKEFLNNPQIFLQQFVSVINRVKARMERQNIVYIPTGGNFDPAKVFNNYKPFEVSKGKSGNAVEVEHSLYNYIKYDSETVELKFANKIDKDNNIELFLKLPTKEYTISTPIGPYTPDWAIIKRNVYGENSEIYFVIETKGSSDDIDLREKEDIKIECAKKHFEALGFEVQENKPLVDKDSKFARKQNYSDFALES
jgi:type III restriction enzyme